MSFFIAALKVNLKRLVKLSSLIVVAVFAIAMAIGDYVQREIFLQAGIGVFFYGDSSISDDITQNLEEFSNIKVIRYDSLDSLIDDVTSMKIECGYVFDKNIERYIENGLINRAVKLYKSKATVSDGFTNELVFASLMKTAAPYIAANYLQDKTNESRGDIVSEAKEDMQSFYESGIFMGIEIVSVGGADVYERPKNRIIAGIASIFLFVVFYYIAIGGIDEKKTGLFEKLSERRSVTYLVAYIFAHAIPLWGVTSMFFAIKRGIVCSFAVTGAYVLVLSLAALGAVVWLKSNRGLYAAFPIMSLSVTILGGAFFDPGVFNPLIGEISRTLPIYHFTVYIM